MASFFFEKLNIEKNRGENIALYLQTFYGNPKKKNFTLFARLLKTRGRSGKIFHIFFVDCLSLM